MKGAQTMTHEETQSLRQQAIAAYHALLHEQEAHRKAQERQVYRENCIYYLTTLERYIENLFGDTARYYFAHGDSSSNVRVYVRVDDLFFTLQGASLCVAQWCDECKGFHVSQDDVPDLARIGATLVSLEKECAIECKREVA